MTILRWILLAALAMAFILLSVANWTPVPFRLPDGEMVNMPLPLLLGAAFIAGWLPTWLFHIGAKANWKRKLAKSARGIEDARPVAMPYAPPPAPMPETPAATIVPTAGA